ncbi:hypothetical protein L2E82_50356 [Cichorium intybus]|nr:hypothetical protein L2E82_50356 [Cichorium intybus]
MRSSASGFIWFPFSVFHSSDYRFVSILIFGVVTVVREWYDDEVDGAIDVKAVGEMRRPVDLKEMKGELKNGKEFGLFRQPRLSVVPVPVDI